VFHLKDYLALFGLESFEVTGSDICGSGKVTLVFEFFGLHL
jgi:hypothetical protein